uniref:Craniofacial development protein 2-like n=1 Tax=Saccharum officinarum TaxID=4547 RepID=A0A678TPY0_SACOF|nr:hypothetical protein SO140N16_000001 [Saccharum officinarum]
MRMEEPQRTPTPALRRRLIVTTHVSAPTVPRRRGRGPVPPPRCLNGTTPPWRHFASSSASTPPRPNPNGDAVACRRFASPAVYAPTSTSMGEGHFHQHPQARRMEPAALESKKSEVSRSGQHLPDLFGTPPLGTASRAVGESETKWKGQKAKEVEDTGFKLWYTGITSGRNGVGILIDRSLKDGVVDVRRQGDRIILVKLLVGDSALNVISAYAPQVGLSEGTKRQFWEDLDSMVSTMPISEKLFIGGDLNGHVGATNVGFERVHGGFGYGSRNQEGEDVLNFALAYDLLIANTLFRKRESHLVTFRSGQHSSQIDFILARREDRRACFDCKVLPGECVVPQHKLVVADFRFRVRVHRDKRAKIARTKWWKLRGEAAQTFKERMLDEGPWEEGEDADDMWLKMATCVRKVTSKVFGVSKGGKREAKDTWWWNDEVQRAIREKECFKRLHHDKSVANIEDYRIAKRVAKRAVSVAKGQAYDGLYQRLGTKEGKNNIYRMARIRERKTRDINQIKCIKDGTDRLLVKDEEIKDRWREYFDKLFNGENEGPALELDDSFDDTNRRFVRRIQEAEIGEALKRMKGGGRCFIALNSSKGARPMARVALNFQRSMQVSTI